MEMNNNFAEQDKVYVQDKVILRPKILFCDKTFQSGITNTRDQIINRSASSKYNKIGQQRRILASQCVSGNERRLSQ